MNKFLAEWKSISTVPMATACGGSSQPVHSQHSKADGWPIQAWFWLEWGSSELEMSVPAALSRFRAVHSDSMSNDPHSRWRHNSRSLHSTDHRLRWSVPVGM